MANTAPAAPSQVLHLVESVLARRPSLAPVIEEFVKRLESASNAPQTKPSLRFTPEGQAMIAKAEEQIRNGEGMELDDAFDQLEARLGLR